MSAARKPQTGGAGSGQSGLRGAVSRMPQWAVAMTGAGVLVLGAGIAGFVAANRSFDALPSAAAASLPPTATPTPTPSGPVAGPDGMFATPTPVAPLVPPPSGTATPTPSASLITPAPSTTGATTIPSAVPIAPIPTTAPTKAPTPARTTAPAPISTLPNPATVAPKPQPTSKTPTATKTPKPSKTPSPSKSPTATKVPTPPAPAPATSTATKPAPTPSDEVAVGGPPSGLTVTVVDLNYGKCPSKFGVDVTVDVEFGTSSSAKATWNVVDSKQDGSANLNKVSAYSFRGKVTGIPTKVPVLLTIEVTGPDGSTKNDPLEISHVC